MSYSTPQTKPQICCPNLNCVAPLNTFGSLVCEACQTPLIYRYLWAVGSSIERVSPGTQVAGRYYVTAPKVWLDTQPSLPPDIPEDWSDEVASYLSLYPYRLHVPQVYSFWLEHEAQGGAAFLLENMPLDARGHLYPAIAQMWEQATAVRQVYWLWQMLQLWTPLLERGVASSLLSASNIRVEGWRIRLCQLFVDADVLPALEAAGSQSHVLGLADLANLWLGWVDRARPRVLEPLQAICRQMQVQGAEKESIAMQLNQLLIEEAAQLPLHLQIAGGTDQGPQRSHNEDTCYPTTLNSKPVPDGLMPQLAIVCDGIGGHEGGEVASQTAVRSLKLQLQALLTEVAEQSELITPQLVAEQLEAIVRVVNNLISAQNDQQGREDRRRMGTTLTLALQLPQRVGTSQAAGVGNSHELYLVNVGDSRAYWITQQHCHLLTVDDDVTTREVRLGRSLYREALKRPDAGSLTQAIGTRDAEFLHPSVQRFIVEEDGLLLLCSDGLSDNDLVERFWTDHTEAILKGHHALDLAVKAWIDLANQQNGHDNTSVVLMHCQVSASVANAVMPGAPISRRTESEWTAASRILSQDEPTVSGDLEQSTNTGNVRHRSKTLIALFSLGILLLLGSGIGLLAWSQLDPAQFQQFRERVLPTPSSPNRP